MLGAHIPSQDFDSLRRQCLLENELFTDPYFPPEASSLFFSREPPANFIWKRITDFCSDPQLYVDGASRFDVTQGALGDCWLISAMASLTQNLSLLNMVVPKDQSFEKLYAGIFHFRIWHFGEWVDVIVDDYLPTFNGRLVFAHSTERNEFWSALLEKAYAKLHGSYESLKGGRTSEAMEDFTGGVKEVVDMTDESSDTDLFSLLINTQRKMGLICCSIRKTGSEEGEVSLDNGLVAGHAYSVTDARKVDVRGIGKLDMVRVRNPWGNGKEWTGAWSDNSTEWNLVSSQERVQLGLTFSNDGEFWMDFEDFRREFTDLEICHSSIDALDEDENITSWNLSLFSGGWSKQKDTAGGCRNYSTFHKNPSFVIDLKEDADNDGLCSVIIALMQKDCRKQKKLGVQENSIGFTVYKHPTSSTELCKEFFLYNKSTGNSGSFTNLREVTVRLNLSPGRYIIVPCLFHPDKEGEFLLRIFTENSLMHSNNAGPDSTPFDGDTVADSSQANPGEDISLSRLEMGKHMFVRIAGSDGRIDGDELIDLLTGVLSRDLKKNILDRDTCRALIQLEDRDRAGSLNFEQCQVLLGYIGRWKGVFRRMDETHSHLISKHQLSLALQQLGYDLSPECLEVIINRFSIQEQISFSDYIAIVCRVKMVTDMFKLKHDPKKKLITFTLETLLLNSLKL